MHIYRRFKTITTQAELGIQAAAAKDSPPIQCQGLRTTGSMLASLQAAEPGRGWSSDPAPCHYLRQHRWWKWPCPCWLGAPTCRGARHRMGAQSLKQSHNTSISRYISFLSCQNTSMQRDPCKGHGLCSCQAC